jgi:hypothetical protein
MCRGTGETFKSLNQDSKVPGRGLNLGHSKAAVLFIKLRRYLKKNKGLLSVKYTRNTVMGY